MPSATRRPVLVVGGEAASVEPIVEQLHRLGLVAVAVDACASALEMMQVVEFAVVIVNVEDDEAWDLCRQMLASAACPVAIVTRFLAPDRRFRDAAFAAGAAAYLCPPCDGSRLRQMLRRVARGETPVEITEGAAFRLS